MKKTSTTAAITIINKWVFAYWTGCATAVPISEVMAENEESPCVWASSSLISVDFAAVGALTGRSVAEDKAVVSCRTGLCRESAESVERMMRSGSFILTNLWCC